VKYLHSDQPLFNRFARLLTAEGDPAPGGGSPPAADTPPAGEGGAAPAPAVEASAPAPASEPTSLLSEAKAPDAPAPVPETEEQKAERLKNETPEEKTARETKEAEVRTEALKSYDGLKLPEGMPADQPLFSDFKNLALDEGIAPEKAQKLVDLMVPKIVEAQKAPYEAWATMQEEWAAAVKSDKELGDTKEKFDASVADAARAIDHFTKTPEENKALRSALGFTGAGNHPELFRFFARVGEKFREGGPVNAKPTAGPKPSAASQIYPTMNQSTS